MLYGMGAMTGKTTRVRVNRELADEAMRALGVKSRSEAARVAVMSLIGRAEPIHLAGQSAGKGRDRRAETKAARSKRRLNLDTPLIRPAGRRIDIASEKAYELVELP
jgi:Arc/MetJ family transcription regulator